MEDVEEQETREQHTLNSHFESNLSRSRETTNSNGFIVQGGPWEQRAAPNTASVTEFPSFGRNTAEEQPQISPVSGAWGGRR